MTEQKTLLCRIRKEPVAALPEEHVRQRFLSYMIDEKGFPPALIAVEKSLRQLPHLTSDDRKNVPDRRADILCFAKDMKGHGLYPLLLVECKAVKLTSAVISQVVGYNHYVRASFLAVVNQDEMRMGWYDPNKKEYQFVNDLPPYSSIKHL